MLFSTALVGQITLGSSHFPKIGDTLFTAVDNLPGNIEITAAGPNQNWDFSLLQSPFTRKTPVLDIQNRNAGNAFPRADFMTDLGENKVGYFQVKGNKLTLLGYKGDDPAGLGVELTTDFKPALVERKFPLRYKDKYDAQTSMTVAFSTANLPQRVLSQLPIRPDSLRIRVQIDRMFNVDAWGTLIIPGGIYDVLREKRTEIKSVRLDAKLSFLPWQDITDLLSDNQYLGNSTTIFYTFLSKESKEAIATVQMNQDESQAMKVEYKINDLSSNVQNSSSIKPGVYAYPNPAIVNVRFEFSNLPPGEYELKIYNILAQPVWSERYYINGSRIEKVSVLGLRKGTYLYSLINDRGKTITTKRLLVIKP